MKNHNAAIDNESSTRIISRLICQHVQPYTSTVVLAIFFMLIVAICSAVIVRLVEPAIDKLFITKDRQMLYILPMMMVGITAIKGIAEFFQSYLIKYLGQRVLSDLQLKLYENLLQCDLAFIEQQSAGRLISRFTNDITLMRGAVSNLLVGIAKHFMTVLLLILLMFNLEPTLSIITFVIFPLAIYPIIKVGKRLRKVAFNTQEELGNYTAQLDETFSAIRIVKSYTAEKFEWLRAQNVIEGILQLYVKAARLDALTSPIMEILSGIAIGGIIWYGGLMIIEGETTPGRLFAFLTAFVSAYRPYKSLVSLNVSLQEGLAAAKRVFMIFDMHPQITDADDAQDLNVDAALEIKLNDICLKFGQKTALSNVNLEFPSKQMIAIVGESGSGKTSISNLLQRFYDPTAGHLTINNIDLAHIKLHSIRNIFSFVAQETILFDASIADNIAYGTEVYDLEKIIEAAKLAGAHDFISKLSDGYHTSIGNKGFTLSGGQRQRLAIARAIFKNAPVMLFDEATSALDAKSENHIIQSLESIRGKYTMIIITHRLNSIRNADHIIVMSDGKVAEQGSHEQLIAAKGEYHSLYKRQQNSSENID